MNRPASMDTTLVVPLCWVLWTLLAVAVLVASALVLTEKHRSPEVGHNFGVLIVAVLFVGLLIGSGVLYWVARRRSWLGLIVVALVFAYPVVLVAARPLVAWFGKWREQRESARIGSFADPRADALGRAVLANDAATLRTLLAGQKPPAVVDRAGLDLVALACFAVVERQGGVEPLRVLLEAGADPRQTRLPEGQSLLHWLILRRYRNPAAFDAVALLLKHGADPDATSPASPNPPLHLAEDQPDLVRLLLDHGADIDGLDEYGQPPVVRFIGTQHWDTALLLVERGARLDLASTSGVSIDYYLKDWSQSVHGEHPPGWDRLRQAIAQRRATPAASN